MAIVYFTPERFELIEALIPLLQNTPHWENRFKVEWYVNLCQRKGFAKTHDQMRLCAERYLAGKRKVTPPGTERRKKAERRMREILANTPAELMVAVDTAIANGAKAVDQFKAGNEKALNALVGAVMKQYKGDPAIIRELLLRKIK